MNVSAKTEYACIAVLDLAVHYGSGKPLRVREIAEANGIPPRFLVQILLQLKGVGIVSSTRGASGGYHLVRDPAELTLSEVMAFSEGQVPTLASSASRETVISRTLQHVWQGVLDAEREMLSAMTFADLVTRVQGQTEHMYFI